MVNKSDEDSQIMGWLSPLERNNRHQDERTSKFQCRILAFGKQESGEITMGGWRLNR